MDNNINHYLPKIVAKPLADQYGDRLEGMSLVIKLTLYQGLSGDIFDGFSDEVGLSDEQMYVEYPTLLRLFDECDDDTVQKVVQVLALSLSM